MNRTSPPTKKLRKSHLGVVPALTTTPLKRPQRPLHATKPKKPSSINTLATSQPPPSLHSISARSISTKYIKKYSSAPHSVDYSNHKVAFATKSTLELARTSAIFSLCRVKPLVKHANFLIRTTRRVLGDKFLETGLRMTFYGHFCAGANETETGPILQKIARNGIGSILDYGAEPEADEMKVSPSHKSVVHQNVLENAAAVPQHSHSHNGVPCGHNHGESQQSPHPVHNTVDQHIKAHEDLHNVFAFTSPTPIPSEIVIPGLPVISVKRPQTQQLSGSLVANPSEKVATPEDSRPDAGFKPVRRYNMEEGKIFDHEVAAFKRSLDAVVNPKIEMSKLLSPSQLPQTKKQFSKQELLNLAKVLEEPTFIAIKVTALAPTKLLTRISTYINFHTYMWDVLQNRDSATLFYKKTKPNETETDDLNPTDDELLHNTPLHVDDMWDTMTQIEFVDKIIQFYDLTKEDANELFSFYTTDSAKTIISRQDWCTNMNLHHMLSLGSKLVQKKLPPPPKNVGDLLFTFPTLTDIPDSPRTFNSLIDREDIDELNKCMRRLDDVAKYSAKHGAAFFVDAEQTYYQQAVDHMTTDLMAVHNAPDETFQDMVKIYGKSAHPNKQRLDDTQDDKLTAGKIKIITTSVGTNGQSDEVELHFKPPKNLLEAKRLQFQHDIDYMENPTPTSIYKFMANGESTDTPTKFQHSVLHTSDDDVDTVISTALHNYKNFKQPVVWQTYQCYLKDSYYRIRRDFNLAQENGFTFAAKIVRGAYLVGETERAQQLNYTSPLHDSIQDTHNNYNKTMLFLLSQRNVNMENPAHFLIASHNQETVEIATNYLTHELSVTEKQFADGVVPVASGDNKGTVVKVMPKKHQLRTYFAQLYGMGLRLTYPLAANGFAGYNYITYGPVLLCLPYLLRRAQENGSLLGGTATESKLISKELVRRLFGKKD